MNDRNKGNGVIVGILLILVLLVGGGGLTAYWFYQRQQTLIDVDRAVQAERFVRQEAERAAQEAQRALLEAEQAKDEPDEDDLSKNQSTDADEATDTNFRD